MNARKPLPIGPLALVLRHVRPASTSHRIAILAIALAAALLVGIALLLR
ncbi:hypothetical protein EDC02_5981 [Micromonospora sp. Llam0]|nr:hypothetical protein [Micromonospora sp. Llam0]ROO51116.1 hypothetical protein EDC02_5981 [Micromonospora sp. Llam0]